MSDIQVGDMWKATDPEGNKGCFWLDRVEGSTQIWKWEASCRDGSGKRTGWRTSRSGAREQCWFDMYAIFSNGRLVKYSVRFKKVQS